MELKTSSSSACGQFVRARIRPGQGAAGMVSSEWSHDMAFSASEVEEGFKALQSAAFGLDGLSKSIISPILPIISSVVATFFTARLK